MRSTWTMLFLLIGLMGMTQADWETLPAITISWRFEDLFFIDEQKGWACDGSGYIQKTDDGGDSWIEVLNIENRYFRAIEFMDENLGFAGTLSGANSDGKIYRTDNGGEDWEDISGNYPQTLSGVCGLCAAPGGRLFATGVFYGSPYVMYSDNQGDSWQYIDMSNQSAGLVDIAFKDEMNGLLVGRTGQPEMKAAIWGTSDGGLTWEQRAEGMDLEQRAWKIQYLNDSIVYASIEEFHPHPRYFKSSDGGETWTFLEADFGGEMGGTIQGVGFLNEDKGWLGGWGDLLFETFDAGQSWNYRPEIGSTFNRFFKVGNTMYVAGTAIHRYVEEPSSTWAIIGHERAAHGVELHYVDGQLFIQLDLAGYTYAEIAVYSLQGKCLIKGPAGMMKKGKHELEMDVSPLNIGTYFLTLNTYHGIEGFKFNRL